MTKDLNTMVDESEGDYEHFNIIADPGQAVLRVDKFLLDKLPHISRNKIALAAKNGNVLVNGERVKQNYKVKPEDEISMVFSHPKREFEMLAEDIPINIVYEDDAVIIINKPADFVVHPGHGNFTGTLVNALLFHFDNLPRNKKSESSYPGLVHRIDKDNTGLLLIAKTEDALSKMAAHFFNRTIDRHYIALVWGDLEEDKGTIEGNIGRSPSDRKRMAVFTDGEYGKHAVTHYEVLERLGYVTLVRCKLDTGRTHQIRTHMMHIGHPIFGDTRYGGDRIVKGTTFSKYKQFIENCFNILPRQALHAKTLGFEHPTTGDFMKFECDLPDDMNQVLAKWRVYTKSHSADS
jgi:23S rRNA pseudouridine1911/1915/1917 synthase